MLFEETNVTQVSPTMKIALPSGKSLQEQTESLLREAGIQVTRKHPRSCLASLSGVPGIATAVFCTPSEIVRMVDLGHVDLGITGMDFYREFEGARDREKEPPVDVVAELNYSKATNGPSRCVLFTHASNQVNNTHMLPVQLTVVTEYPIETGEFLQRKGIRNPRIVRVRGSAEAFVAVGAYEYGVALVETGDSLRANSLKELATISMSSAVLIQSYQSRMKPAEHAAAYFLGQLLKGVLAARTSVYLMMNVPAQLVEAVTKKLPSLKSPTVQRLADEGFVSVSSVVPMAEVNLLISELGKLGASGFVVVPIRSVL